MALEGGEGSASRPGRFLLPGKTRYALYRRLSGPQGPRPHRSKIHLNIMLPSNGPSKRSTAFRFSNQIPPLRSACYAHCPSHLASCTPFNSNLYAIFVRVNYKSKSNFRIYLQLLILTAHLTVQSGSGTAVGIATRYGLDGPGIESRWRARFSAPIQTGREAHPASYTVGTESFPGVKRQGRDVDHPPYLAPRLKKE